MMRRFRQVTDLMSAARVKRKRLDPVLAWTPEQLQAYQEARWRAVAQRAAARAPFYRALYCGIDLERAPLSALPPVSKRQLMESFDASVTDPALRLAELEAFLGSAAPGERYLGRFHVLLTSGTTGQRGVIVYDRDEWVVNLAASMRSQELMGQPPPRLPRQRMATFTSTNPFHISSRLLRAFDIGLIRQLTIDPVRPLESALPELERFRPDVLFGYPSVLMALAQAQLEERVDLEPERVVAGGEVVTGTFRERVRQAWNCEVFDLYATTETGALAAESPDHRVRYLLEDTTLVEVVDEVEQRMADGEGGEHLLITCLDRVTQPLIRYRVSDRLVVDPPRGPGYPPFRTLRAIEGRAEDALRLKDAQGRDVVFRHPTMIEDLLEISGARQVQVVQEPGRIVVHLVVSDPGADLAARVQRWFRAAAEEHGLRLPELVVDVVPRLVGAEATMGKFRPVECRLPR